tara:strand:- start:80 stop:400 length:321 start_codon:yes stop_codon:yes gene_type:complete
MLVEKHKKNDVVALKLVSGDEILAQWVDDDDNTITLRKPLALAMGPEGVGLIPMMVSLDISATPIVSVNKDKVVMIISPNKILADSYVQATTGISLATPNTQKIIT